MYFVPLHLDIRLGDCLVLDIRRIFSYICAPFEILRVSLFEQNYFSLAVSALAYISSL